MKHQFTLSHADVVAFNRVLSQRLAAKARTGRSRLILLILNIVAWMAIGYAASRYMSLYRTHSQIAPYLNEVLFCLGVGVALLVGTSLYGQHLFRYGSLSNTRWLREPTSVTAASGGLEIETSIVYTRYQWSSFTDFSEDQTMLYLFLDVSWGVVIPKKVFDKPEELQQFRSWVQSSNQTMEPTR